MNNESDALCGSVMIFKKLGPMHEIKHKSRSRRISVSHSNKRSFSSSPVNTKKTINTHSIESEISPKIGILHHQHSGPITKDDFKIINGHQDTLNTNNSNGSENGKINVNQSIDDMLTTLNELMEKIDLDKK